MIPDRPSYINPEDLPYVRAYINAANSGQSASFVGLEVLANLILSVRDLSNRIEELENELARTNSDDVA